MMLWVGFNLFIFFLLFIDLKAHGKGHVVKAKEAIIWTIFWILLALAFNVLVYFWRGHDVALRFFTGYVLEKSLSVDNIFVFLLIFQYFRVPSEYQHKVLFWGILGALIMRALFITAGVAIIHKFHWVIYVFGLFLIITGIKLAFEKDKEVDPEKNPALKLFRRFMPVTNVYHGSKFFIRENGKLLATPLMVVLFVVETTDVVFAVDSIPAILAITTDAFIVYSSNMFAILGLRALYFALAAVMKLFHHLHYGLAAILVFVGIKMMISGHYKIPIVWALGFIAVVLAASVVASLLFPPKHKPDVPHNPHLP